MSLYSDGVKDKADKKCIIMQNNPYKMMWDVWVLFLLLIVSMVVPMRLAFANEETTFWFLVYLVTDLFFLVDIFLNFFTSIDDEQKVYSITDRKTIARKYLRGWFWVDVLAILPIDIVLKSTQTEATALARFAKIGKLYKLIRMIRLAKVLKLLKSKNAVMS